MPKVAILGGTGFIGEELSKIFEANDFDLVLLGRGLNQNGVRRYCQVNLFDPESQKGALQKEKPDIVISTAWDTEPGKFWTSELNVKYRNSTLNFAELAFKEDVSTFIGLGTVSEYGDNPGYCNARTSTLKRTDIYSKSKIETGLLLEALSVKFGTKTHWARIFQAFGPNEKKQRYIPSLISTLQQKNRFFVKTPNFILDWIHTEDIASAIYYGYVNSMNHFLDVGTGIGTSVTDLSNMICSKFNFDTDLLDYTQALPNNKIAVVDKYSQLLANGWAPKFTLSDRIDSLE